MVSTWTRLRAAVDPIVRPYHLYTAYPLGSPEYVGTVLGSVDDVRQLLVEAGYEPQYLSAAKEHPETGQLHDLSYRRVPDEHPEEAEGTAVGTWRPIDCQYHFHAFATADGVDGFSHYELRPDFWSPEFDVERLEIHYHPTYDDDYLRGVTDLDLPDVP